MTDYQGTDPLLCWGDVDNLDTAWTKNNGCTVATGMADPFGGTGAYTITDASGAAVRYLSKIVTLAAGVTDLAVYFILKQGTATDNVLTWFDSTASANRREARIAWSGGIPTITSINGSAALDLAISLGASWWLIRIGVTNIVAANTNQIFLVPAGVSSNDVTGTGTLTVYRRSVVVFGRHMDDALAHPMPREGSEWAKASSGVEDAWITGTDQLLKITARRIPQRDTGATGYPVNATGWDGRAPYIGVDAGVGAFLTYARQSNVVRLCPDRSAVATYRDVYLQSPRMEPPIAEPWVDPTRGLVTLRTLPLVLRSSDDTPMEGW